MLPHPIKMKSLKFNTKHTTKFTACLPTLILRDEYITARKVYTPTEKPMLLIHTKKQLSLTKPFFDHFATVKLLLIVLSMMDPRGSNETSNLNMAFGSTMGSTTFLSKGQKRP